LASGLLAEDWSSNPARTPADNVTASGACLKLSGTTTEGGVPSVPKNDGDADERMARDANVVDADAVIAGL
jgi:hypothetical protein